MKINLLLYSSGCYAETAGVPAPPPQSPCRKCSNAQKEAWSTRNWSFEGKSKIVVFFVSLNDDSFMILQTIIQPDFSIYLVNCMESSDERKGDSICFMIVTLWCTDVTIIAQFCSTNLEYLIIGCCSFICWENSTL